MHVWAIVVAGGTGSRFGAPKQFAELAGRRVVDWSVDAARKACDHVVLVVPPRPPAAGRAADDTIGELEGVAVVTGAATRSGSVRAGLDAVAENADIIVVHDAARPLAPPDLWEAVIAAVRGGADAAIPTVAVTDTVKERRDDGSLVTLDRDRLVAVQTPQAFRSAALRQAHRAGVDATDDAALVEALGGTVAQVAGYPENLKITLPSDLITARALLAPGAPGEHLHPGGRP